MNPLFTLGEEFRFQDSSRFRKKAGDAKLPFYHSFVWQCRDLDFPSRKLRQRPPAADLAAFRAKRDDLQEHAVTQEQRNPASSRTAGPIQFKTTRTSSKIMQCSVWRRLPLPPLPFSLFCFTLERRRFPTHNAWFCCIWLLCLQRGSHVEGSRLAPFYDTHLFCLHRGMLSFGGSAFGHGFLPFPVLCGWSLLCLFCFVCCCGSFCLVASLSGRLALAPSLLFVCSSSLSLWLSCFLCFLMVCLLLRLPPLLPPPPLGVWWCWSVVLRVSPQLSPFGYLVAPGLTGLHDFLVCSWLVSVLYRNKGFGPVWGTALYTRFVVFGFPLWVGVTWPHFTTPCALTQRASPLASVVLFSVRLVLCLLLCFFLASSLLFSCPPWGCAVVLVFSVLHYSPSVPSCPQMGCVGTLGLTKGFTTMTVFLLFSCFHLAFVSSWVLIRLLRSLKAAS